MPQPAARAKRGELGLVKDLLDSAALVRAQADLMAARSQHMAADALRARADRYEAKANAIIAIARDAKRPRDPRL